MDPAFIGIVCGLKSEAQAIGPIADIGAIRIAVSGAHAERARERARALVRDGARALVSFGVSGGLSATVQPGELLVGTEIVRVPEGHTWCLSQDLLSALSTCAAAAGFTLAEARLAGSDVLIDNVAVKRQLASDYAVHAVDMESHAVAEVAAEAGLRCAAIRAVADPWDRAMPPSVAGAVAEDGSIRTLSVLRTAAGRPKDWLDLVRLGRENKAAHDALGRCARHVFPTLLRVMHIG
ncbi:MAG: hypothetical protein ACFB6R_17650 [Alphaproteobacteria bacterium]